MVNSKLLIGIGAALLFSGTVMGTVLVLDAFGLTQSEKKIELKLKVSDASKVYDGSPLVPDSYEIIEGTKLLEGNYIVPTYIGSITEYGSISSTMSCEIYSKDGKLVSSQYNVSVTEGTLSVEKRDLSVLYDKTEVPYGESKIYDSSYTLLDDTSLAPGHRIVPGTDISSLSVGDETICPVVTTIYDVNGTDVTRNYNILKSEGTIKVSKRHIEFVPEVTSKIYDGYILEPKGYSLREGELLPGHTAEIEYKDSKSACGSYQLSLNIIIYDENRNDVTNLYDINDSEIFACYISNNSIKVNMRNFEKDFDGESFENEMSTFLENQTITDDEGRELYVRLSSDSPVLTFNKAGKYVLTSADFEIYSLDDKVDISNYEVKFNDDYFLLIKKITIGIYFAQSGYEKTYDGEEYKFTDTDFEFDLPEGSSLDETKLSLTNKVFSGNRAYYITDNGIEDFTVRLDMVDVVYDGEIISSSVDYTLDDVSCSVSVTQRNLNIKTKYITMEYESDGRISASDDVGMSYVDYSSVVLASGDIADYSSGNAEFDISLSRTPRSYTDEGTIAFTIRNSSGDDVSAMYNMSLEVSYQIVKANKTITLPSLSKEYDGEEIDISQYESMVQSIGNGQDLTFHVNSIVNIGPDAGTYSITGDDITYDEDDNYLIFFSPGVITINPKKVSIILPSLIKEYDGTDFGLNGESVYDDGTLSVTLKDINYTDAGKYSIGKDNLDYEENNNYEVNVTPGILTISKKIINLTLPSLSKEYDGTDFGLNGESVYDDGTLSVTLKGINYTDSGKYSIGKDNLDYEENNNYEVNVTPGNLTISKKIINLSLPSLSKEYDGTDFGLNGESLYNDGTLSVTLKDINYTDADKYSIGKDNLDYEENNNYEVNVTSGILTISKKIINLTLPSLSKEYDGVGFGVNGEILYDDGAFEVRLAGIDYVNAGTYILNESNVSYLENDNYEVSVISSCAVIAKKKVSINLPDITKIYDNSSIGYEGEKIYDDGLLTIEYNSSIDSLINSGTYILDSSYLDETLSNSNYDITYINGSLTINKKDVSVVLPSVTKVYDGESIDLSSFVFEGDGGLEITLATSLFKDAGTYYLTKDDCVITNDSNYNVSCQMGIILIQKKDVTVTLNNITVSSSTVLDNTKCADYVSVNGILDGDTYSVSAVYDSVSDTYTATCTAASSNYSIIYTTMKGIVSRI